MWTFQNKVVRDADMHEIEATVVVIADTHVRRLEELPKELLAALGTADIIVHLGDFTSLELLRDLKGTGRFYGVAGNHDDATVRRELKDMEVLDICGKKIGLIHGMYWPFGSQKRMRHWFREYRLDSLLYGHTHLPTKKMIGRTLFFNPGTASGHFPGLRATFGILTVNSRVEGKIVPLACELPVAGIIRRRRAAFLRFVIGFIQTWPYVDVLGPAARLLRGLLRPFSAMRTSSRGRQAPVPAEKKEDAAAAHLAAGSAK